MVHIVDGGWSEWKNISECSSTCGEGIKVRSRSCSEPPSSCGGKYCGGPDLQFVPCNVNACCPGLIFNCIISSKLVLNVASHLVLHKPMSIDCCYDVLSLACILILVSA